MAVMGDTKTGSLAMLVCARSGNIKCLVSAFSPSEASPQCTSWGNMGRTMRRPSLTSSWSACQSTLLTNRTLKEILVRAEPLVGLGRACGSVPRLKGFPSSSAAFGLHEGQRQLVSGHCESWSTLGHQQQPGSQYLQLPSRYQTASVQASR